MVCILQFSLLASGVPEGSPGFTPGGHWLYEPKYTNQNQECCRTGSLQLAKPMRECGPANCRLAPVLYGMCAAMSGTL